MSDYKRKADVDYIYFLMDPEGDGLIFFKCIEERHRYTRKAVRKYLDDDGWNEEVKNLYMGTVSHLVTEYNVTLRPDEDDIDVDFCDQDGTYWGDWDKRCDYKLTSLEVLNEPADEDTDNSKST